MKTIKVKPPYKSLVQMKYSCGCCSFQWVLLRRGLKWIEQEDFAKALGFRIPKKVSHLFQHKFRNTNKQSEYGTINASKKSAKRLNNFFEKQKIPLHVEWHPVGKIKNPVKFISENLKKGNDLVVIFHWFGLGKRKKSWNIGHICVVAGIKLGKKPKVIIGDPSQNMPKLWECDLDKLIESMDKKYGYERGFYLVSSKR